MGRKKKKNIVDELENNTEEEIIDPPFSETIVEDTQPDQATTCVNMVKYDENKRVVNIVCNVSRSEKAYKEKLVQGFVEL